MRHGRLLIASASLLSIATVLAACEEPVGIRPTPKPTDAAPAPGPLGTAMAVDDSRMIPGLSRPVDVVRDRYGIVHIYAFDAADAFRAQGFMAASDRGLQLELLRRIAEGRMAEILGQRDPSWIDSDVLMRSVGLHRGARAAHEAMPAAGEARRWLEAYSAGVDAAFARLRNGTDPLPEGGAGASRDWFSEWTPVDSLAVLQLRAFADSVRLDEERDLTAALDGALEVFRPDASEPELKRRAGAVQDLLRFAPATSASLIPSLSPGTSPQEPGIAFARHASADLLSAYDVTFATLRTLRARFAERGSSAWAIGPARTLSGNAILAASPQMPLSSDAAFWFVHLEVRPETGSSEPRLAVSGASLPGVPGVWIGNNATVAWAPGASGFDEADLYAEALSAGGGAVSFLGADVALQKLTETIPVEGASPIEHEVLIVPHHGPILPRLKDHAVVAPDAAVGALSFRWPGLASARAFEGMAALLRARTTADARAAVASWNVGANSFTFADSEGSIEVDVQPVLPARERGAFQWDAAQQRGRLPCLIQPGEGGAEWSGSMPSAHVPSVRNPSRAWVVAAGADLAGTTLDNDPSNDVQADGAPAYLACLFDLGFRHERAAAMVDAPGTHVLEGVGALQSDVRSPLGARLAPRLVDVLTRALEEHDKPGTWPTLSAAVESDRFDPVAAQSTIDSMQRWSELGLAARAGVRLTDGSPSMQGADAEASKAALLFNVWLVRVLQLTLQDELARVGVQGSLPGDLGLRTLLHLVETEPTMLASYDPELRDSILWDDADTPEFETRDGRMVVALLDAFDWLDGLLGEEREDWRWGLLHTARLGGLVGGVGVGAIPRQDDALFPRGFPRHGDLHAIDETRFDLAASGLPSQSFTGTRGAAIRYVVELGPSGPRVRIAMAGHPAPGVTAAEDEVEYWRNNQQHDVPWEQDEVLGAATRRTVIGPAQ